MRAVFYRPGQSDTVVGTAVWKGSGVDVEADQESVLEAIRRIFRPSPVTIDDPSLRSYGTAGPILLLPGSLRWFRAAAEARSEAEGFGVRFVPDSEGAMGWDPAGAYRTFTDAVERKERLGGARGTRPTLPAEARA